MSLLRSLMVAVAIGGLIGMAPVALAQYNPKQDGKDFSKDVLIPMGKGKAESVPTADMPDYYTATPPQTSYKDNPTAMESAGEMAKGSNEAYLQMLQSQVSRAEFDPADLAETVAPGQTIQQDPGHYTSGMSVDGAPGTCVELPPMVSSPGFYEQACNSGYTGGGAVAVNQSCNVTIHVQTTTEQFLFSSGITQGIFQANPNCSIAAGPVAQGVNITFMGRTYRSTSGPGTVWRCTGTTYIDFDPHPVYATNTIALLPPTEDASACAAIEADSTCVFNQEVCSDLTPATRMVGGVSVTLPCWGKRRDYTCTTVTPPSPATDCPDLEALGCTYDREQCLTDETPCLTVEEVWKCPLPPEPTGEKKFICDGDVFCIDGSCDTIEREANDEFKDAVVALNAIQQAGKEFDPDTLTIFAGGAHACTKLVFGLKNCCVPRGLPLIGGCSGEDTDLKTKREEGLCTYVGSWCSSKVLGICLEKKERHCCYASKISRVIQEQGRVQLGKAWDDPKDETCEGFTLAEFQSLDLSVMDFSEVYADFLEAAKLPNEIDALDDIKTKIEAYYNAHG